MMHATTFGAFPAATQLAALLEARADTVLTKKVARTIQDFNEGLRQLEQVADAQYRGRLALLWRDDCRRRVAIDPGLDKFVRNVITTHAKRLLTSPRA